MQVITDDLLGELYTLTANEMLLNDIPVGDTQQICATLIGNILDAGYIIVKSDSVVTKRRTDRELIELMKAKGLEKNDY